MSRLTTKQRRARRRRLDKYEKGGAMKRSERNAADLQRQSMAQYDRERGRPVSARSQASLSWW